jgi:phenylacetate-CoA ligase
MTTPPGPSPHRPGAARRRAMFELKRHTVLRGKDGQARRAAADEVAPLEELLERQRRAAAAHARYAMANSPFYRQLYSDAGFTLDDLRDPAAFASLPVVEKDDVRAHFEEFRTPDAVPRNTVTSRTGGSTGEPLTFLGDARVSILPLEWRLRSWWGVDASDDVAVVSRQVRTRRQTTIEALKWWPTRRIQLDAYRIGDDEVRAFARRWQRVRPALLTGYAGGILEFARTLERLGLDVHPPTAIATTASPLTEAQRAEIEAVLRAPVHDHYRSSEIPWMGGECRQRDGHHLFVLDRVVELLDEGDHPVPAGETGQVVATDLTNRVFPLVRYRLGDCTRAIPDPCPCGVTLPRIARVQGRQSDGLRLPDGTWVAGEGLYQVFNSVQWAVRQAQFDQAADYSVTLRCVLTDHPDAAGALEPAVEDLRGRLRHGVAVRLEVVPAIPSDGGKIRFIRSAVPDSAPAARSGATTT